MQDASVPITVRISPRVKAAVTRQMRRDHLSLSDVVRVLLLAYAKGEITIDVTARSRTRTQSAHQ